MAMTHAQAMQAVPQAKHNALAAAGINPSDFILWVVTHGCDVVKAFRAILPLLPISDAAKAAITEVLDILCPA